MVRTSNEANFTISRKSERRAYYTQSSMPDRQEEFRDILSQALAPLQAEIANLPNKAFIEETLERATRKIEEKFEEKLEEERAKIQSLEARIEILESKCVLLEKLEFKLEETEQYSRRTCLRFDNIDLPEKGTKEDCMAKIGKVLQDLDCGIGLDSVDRAHRIGPVRVGDDGSAPRQQVIAKFKSFADRTKVYRNRKKLSTVRIKLDLTKNRLVTLGKANTFAKNNPIVDFVFADINCHLAAKLKNGNFIFFDSVEKLHELLGEQ